MTDQVTEIDPSKLRVTGIRIRLGEDRLFPLRSGVVSRRRRRRIETDMSVSRFVEFLSNEVEREFDLTGEVKVIVDKHPGCDVILYREDDVFRQPVTPFRSPEAEQTVRDIVSQTVRDVGAWLVTR